jgi:hypothetical protein
MIIGHNYVKLKAFQVLFLHEKIGKAIVIMFYKCF